MEADNKNKSAEAEVIQDYGEYGQVQKLDLEESPVHAVMVSDARC